MGGMIRRPANKQQNNFKGNFNQRKSNKLKSNVPGTRFNWHDNSAKKKRDDT